MNAERLFEALEPRCLLASFSVDNLGDAGAGSLRQAVLDANASPGADEITFAVTGTITFTSAIRVEDDLAVTGPGRDLLTLSGGDASPIFVIGPNSTTASISDLTIADSRDAAGAIINLASLTLSNMAFLNGHAHTAAALLSTGPLWIFNCTFSGNTTDQSGAGVIASFAADTHIEDSEFSDNSASGQHAPGAVFSDGGTLTIIRSTFSGNFAAAPGAFGGAIESRTSATIADSTFSFNSADRGGAIAASGLLTVTGCTFSENSAVMGGAVYIKGSGGTFEVVNSTISANIATVLGSGVFNTSGNTLAIDNSTIVDNVGGLEGGGILNQGVCTIRSTIVAGNTAGDVAGAEPLDAASAFNLIGSASSAGGLTDGVNGNIVGSDPLLGPLADNGGPTFTHELLGASPAVDAGANPRQLDFDQRGSGFARELGGGVDIGAFEGSGLGGRAVIGEFSLSSASFTRGQSVTLRARGVEGGPAPVARVDFFLDADGDGVVDLGEFIGSSTAGVAGEYSFVFTGTVGLVLGQARFIAVARNQTGGSSLSVSTTATVANAPPTIGALTPSAQQFVQGAGEFTLTAGAGDVDGFVRFVRFYADLNNDGVADPDELLGVDNDRTDGFSYTLTQQQSLELPTGPITFLCVAHDSSAGVSTPTPATATLLFSTSAGPGHGVLGTADTADKTSVTTVNRGGHVLVFEQGWAVADLQALTGAPKVIGDSVIWHDPNDGRVYVAAPTAHGLLLFTRTESGSWSVRNLTSETAAAHSPTHGLTTFTSVGGVGGVVVIAGITGTGRLVAFEQTFTRPGAPPSFAYRDISGDLESQGMPTPRLDSLISYVTTWNSWHLAGIDDDGRIQSVWINKNVEGFTKWRVDDLTLATGAPAITGQLAVTLTSWGGINLTGLDAGGNLLTTWWVPEFAGDWRVNNLSEQFGGAKFIDGNVSGYTTPWDGLNYVGIDQAGKVTVYWWSPGVENWSVSPLLPDTVPTADMPRGKLTSSASAAGTLNVYGAAEDGDVLRLSWTPDASDAGWRAENLSEVAERR